MGAESPPSALGARGRVASEAQAVHIWAWRVPTGACTVAQRALASRTDVFLMQRILSKVETARPRTVGRALTGTSDETAARAAPRQHPRPCRRRGFRAPTSGPLSRGESRARSAVRPNRKCAASLARKPHLGSLGRVVPGALPARARGMPDEPSQVCLSVALSRDLINVPPSDASSRASARICRRRGRGEPSCPAFCPWVPPT